MLTSTTRYLNITYKDRLSGNAHAQHIQRQVKKIISSNKFLRDLVLAIIDISALR